MPNSPLINLITNTLEEMKAVDLVNLDVAHLTSVTDNMVICSGTSSRHVKSIADRLVEVAKANGFRPLGVAGEEASEWVLVDLGDAVVHVMEPAIRNFYQLEKLWSFEDEASEHKRKGRAREG